MHQVVRAEKSRRVGGWTGRRLFFDFVLGIRFVFSFFCSWTLLISVLCMSRLIESLFFRAGFSESKAAVQLSRPVPSLNLLLNCACRRSFVLCTLIQHIIWSVRYNGYRGIASGTPSSP